MYVSKDLTVTISKKLIDEAGKVSGSINKLSAQKGLNVITNYRISKLGLQMSFRTALTCISVLGVDKSVEIIHNELQKAQSDGLGTVGAYLKDYKLNRKLRDKRFRDERNSKATLGISDI